MLLAGAGVGGAEPALTYVANAKALALMVAELLAAGAAVGCEVVARAKPPLTRQGYVEFRRRMSRRETYDGNRAAAGR